MSLRRSFHLMLHEEHSLQLSLPTRTKTTWGTKNIARLQNC